MSEQDDALEGLDRAGVLDGLRWARRAAYRRVMQDYDPDTGHDQAWIGMTAHRLLTDRLDRVFSCGRYAVESNDDADAGLDILAAGITQADLESMPTVAPGTVVRDDLNGSPGWRCDTWRWLLASHKFGDGAVIPWTQKSHIKQRVASQPPPDQMMFSSETMGLPEIVDVLREHSSLLERLPTTTLILAHSVDRDSGTGEFSIGRPRLNRGGGDAWHWNTDLLVSPPGDSGSGPVREPKLPNGPSANDVPDAPVRLRPEAAEGDQR